MFRLCLTLFYTSFLILTFKTENSFSVFIKTREIEESQNELKNSEDENEAISLLTDMTGTLNDLNRILKSSKRKIGEVSESPVSTGSDAALTEISDETTNSSDANILTDTSIWGSESSNATHGNTADIFPGGGGGYTIEADDGANGSYGFSGSGSDNLLTEDAIDISDGSETSTNMIEEAFLKLEKGKNEELEGNEQSYRLKQDVENALIKDEMAEKAREDAEKTQDEAQQKLDQAQATIDEANEVTGSGSDADLAAVNKQKAEEMEREANKTLIEASAQVAKAEKAQQEAQTELGTAQEELDEAENKIEEGKQGQIEGNSLKDEAADHQASEAGIGKGIQEQAEEAIKAAKKKIQSASDYLLGFMKKHEQKPQELDKVVKEKYDIARTKIKSGLDSIRKAVNDVSKIITERKGVKSRQGYERPNHDDIKKQIRKGARTIIHAIKEMAVAQARNRGSASGDTRELNDVETRVEEAADEMVQAMDQRAKTIGKKLFSDAQESRREASDAVEGDGTGSEAGGDDVEVIGESTDKRSGISVNNPFLVVVILTTAGCLASSNNRIY